MILLFIMGWEAKRPERARLPARERARYSGGVTDSTPPRPPGRLRRWIRGLFLVMTSLALVLVMIRLVFFEGPPRPPEPLEGGPILDMHAHVAGIGAGGSGCFVSKPLREGYKYPIYVWALGTSEKELQEKGDKVAVEKLAMYMRESHHVRGMVVLAMDGILGPDGELDREHTQVYVPNEFIRDEVRKYPGLMYGASINPYRKDAIERLVQAKADGAVLLKWIPSIMGIDPADPKLRPFYQKLIELKMPLLSHAGQERSFGDADDKLCDPLLLRLPLEMGVTVIAAHVATTGANEGQDNFERIQPLFDEFPHLYCDISSLTQINKLGFLARAMKKDKLHERMIYGSDWPLQFVPLVSPYYQALHLDWPTMRRIARIQNPFDRDVEIKIAMGVPASVFHRAEKVLGLGADWHRSGR